MTRKKMSNLKIRLILVPFLAALLIVCLVFTLIADTYSYVLDINLGRGKRRVIIPSGTENWDTDYYNQRFSSSADAKAAALEVLLDVNNEGMVLLKNDGVLPLAEGAGVTPFGKGHKFPHYDSPNGTASMKHSFSYAVSPEAALKAVLFKIVPHASNLQPQTTSTNKTVEMSQNDSSDYNNYPAQPQALPDTISITRNSFGANSRIPELAAGRYDELTAGQKAGMKSTTALVFISRTGSEGSDRKFDGYDDGTPHYLALSKNEKDMIAKAKEICGKVVLILNATNPFELMPVMSGELEVNAILLAGNPGENGFYSMANILSGRINPSGRLYDIFATDFLKGPEMKNFGNFSYADTGSTYRTYVEYEEGMYVGYRYYETAHDIEADGFVYGETDSRGGVKTKGAVAYPFGYGLSYTQFTQTISAYSDIGPNITVSVKVDNTGTRAGKEVIQLYFTPPYTDLDKAMKIEKPTVTLIAFAKTKIIAAGDSDFVTLSFSKEEMTSYCYTRKNTDESYGCYMLEAGDYTISLRKNSHDVIDSKVWENDKTIWYENNNPRQLEKNMQSAMNADGRLMPYPSGGPERTYKAATNLFQYMSDYMNEMTLPLTRASWNNTLPVNQRVNGLNTQKDAGVKYNGMFGTELDFDPLTDPVLGDVEGSHNYTAGQPVQKAKNGLTVFDLRGKDFFDENWEILLDQLDYDTDKRAILQLLTGSNYRTPAIPSIGMPQNLHVEGANGIRLGIVESLQYKTATWCMPPTMAATWNVVLCRETGEAMAQEALTAGVHARYSPALNLHRSPFTGRHLEYFSEDPLLSGKIAASILNGSTNGGLIEHIKHFGLNDQETNRGKNLHTWATEQVVREIYNRPFEIAIREVRRVIKYTLDNKGNTATRIIRGANAMMAAQNCFGHTTAFANYDLVTRLVRDEWGFYGIINTDWFSFNKPGSYELAILAGTDCWLTGDSVSEPIIFPGYDTATTRTAIRRSIHRVAFQIANSATLQNAPPGAIIVYDLSVWRIWLIVINAIGYTLILAGIVFIVYRYRDEKKHPDRYKH